MENKPSFTHGDATIYLKSLQCKRIQLPRDYIKVVSGNNETRTMRIGYSFPVSKGVFRSLKQALLYLKLEYQAKNNEPMNTTDWDLETAKNIPQENTSDCGVFTCSFAECLSRGGEFDFAQKDIQSLRRRMVHNIVEKEL